MPNQTHGILIINKTGDNVNDAKVTEAYVTVRQRNQSQGNRKPT